MSTNVAIIVAGGEGTRFGCEGGKQLAVVAGMSVLGHTVAAFEKCAAINEIVVVVHPLRVAEYSAVIDRIDAKKVVTVVPGGETRLDSVASGLEVCASHADIIVIHDGARPLVTPALIEEAIRSLVEDPSADGVVVGHPLYDTVKSVDGSGYVVCTEDRERLWVVQTPQVFRAAVLRDAYEKAILARSSGTDDASIVEQAGGRIGLVLGPRDNLKVTVPEDLIIIERLLARRVVHL
ncbi:MAG: 2-C-methyl-D-erythritol 4-phosphate cytidylyltransferase [Coriobacteriia bacterium]|nr:2-C-methyl-D-erythritol 4-phosphate cytidylyltransferase [Coriobacteriia bacterium]